MIHDITTLGEDWAHINDGGATGGDATLEVSCGNEYFGRESRSGYANIASTGASATLNVVQQPADEFVTIESVSTLLAAGGTVTVAGYTNSSKLTFAVSGAAAAAVTAISNITYSYGPSGSTSTAQTSNGGAIPGDPGRFQRLSYSVELTLAANTAVTSRTFTLTVTPNGGASLAVSQNLTQPAGSAYICFDQVGGSSQKTVTFNSKGAIGTATTEDVIVKSNDDWSITTGTN